MKIKKVDNGAVVEISEEELVVFKTIGAGVGTVAQKLLDEGKYDSFEDACKMAIATNDVPIIPKEVFDKACAETGVNIDYDEYVRDITDTAHDMIKELTGGLREIWDQI